MPRLPHTLIILVAMFLVLCLPRVSSAGDDYVPYVPGMQLFRGWDTATGDFKETCMTGETIARPIPVADQSYADFMHVSSNEDIASQVNFSATAAANFMAFSGTMKFDLLRSVRATNYGYHGVGFAIVQLVWQTVNNEALKPDYIAIRDNSTSEFRNRCGDRFIAGIKFGAEYYGVISAQTSSLELKGKVQACASAQFGGAEGKSCGESVSGTTTVSELLELKHYSQGVSSGTYPGDAVELGSYVRNFHNLTISSGGKEVEVILRPYPGASYPSIPERARDLFIKRSDLISISAEAEYTKEHWDEFYTDFKGYELSAWKDRVEAVLARATDGVTQIDAVLNVCRANPSNTTCAMPQSIAVAAELRELLPPRYKSPCQDLAVPESTVRVHPLSSACGGDKDFKGHGPDILIKAELKPAYGGKEIHAHTYCRMKETEGDRTCLYGRAIKKIAEVPEGCFFQPGSNEDKVMDGRLRGTNRKDNHEPEIYENGTGIVSKATCKADSDGDDRGRVGCTSITIDGGSLHLNHIEEHQGANTIASEGNGWFSRTPFANRLRRVTVQTADFRARGLQVVPRSDEMIKATKRVHIPASRKINLRISPKRPHSSTNPMRMGLTPARP